MTAIFSAASYQPLNAASLRMSVATTVIWGGSQVAALLLSKDIILKALAFGGSTLYQRLGNRSARPSAAATDSHRPHHQHDLDADLTRVKALLAQVGVEDDADGWCHLDAWEIAVSQPGSAHQHMHLLREAHPRDVAAWQLKESLEDVLGHLEAGRRHTSQRLQGAVHRMQSRSEALIKLMHVVCNDTKL